MTTGQKAGIATAIAAVALVGAYYGLCTSLRFTKGDMINVLRETEMSVREACAKNPDSVLPMFEKMRGEKVWRVRFREDWDNMSNKLPAVSRELRVSSKHLSGMVEDAFILFAGNGFPDAASQARIRKLLAFAEELKPTLDAPSARTLQERMLDAHFVVNDFDGAVAILEKGLPGHSGNWCKAAIAKIRAHQAEEKKDDAEALKQFTAFGEAMAAEPDTGIPEFDPTSGVAYCRAWVLAKNARRCSEYAKRLGKADEAATFLAKAKELYAQALQKTTEEKDGKSLVVLKKEIAEAGL